MERIGLLTKADLDDFKKDLMEQIKEFASPRRRRTDQTMAEKRGNAQAAKYIPRRLQNKLINGTLVYTKVGSILYYMYADIIKLLNDNHS